MIKRISAFMLILVALFSLSACGKSSDTTEISRDEYDKMIDIIQLNDDYDLIDVRSALYSFAPKFINARSQDDIETAISYISNYSTSLLVSSLKTSSYHSQGEEKSVVGIYYCYPEKSSNGKGKFLIVTSLSESSDSFNYSYMLMTLDSTGRLTQIERW